MTTEDKQRYFNELASRWDSLPAPEGAPGRVRAFVTRAAAPDAERILDVGCGTGVLLPALRERCPRAAITELDLAEEMLRENAAKWRQAPIRWVCADGARLPFRGAAFDLVLCFGVLPHFEDLTAALAELARVLRAGGALAVGHLMGSAELNAFHRSLGEPVAGDVLPGAAELSERLGALGLVVAEAEDAADGYFVRGRKR
jgi:ubiquinone/menaquinone biosynthesis C-methylase UbiE